MVWAKGSSFETLSISIQIRDADCLWLHPRGDVLVQKVVPADYQSHIIHQFYNQSNCCICADCPPSIGRLSMTERLISQHLWSIGSMKFLGAMPTARWIATVANLSCTVVEEAQDSHYEWRRIQTSEQQAQRERKSIIQKALVFTRRANAIMNEELG